MNLELNSPEVVAIAAHSRKIWPAAVVGVDYGNRELLQDLVLDGTRSLIARGLAGVENGHVALDSRLVQSLRPVFASAGVSAFIGTADDTAEVVGGAIYAYPDDDSCIAEVVRATGQRELLTLDRDQAVQLIRTFAESVYRSTPSEDGASDIVLYVGAPVGPDLPVTVVRPGRLSHGVAPEDRGPVVDAVDADGWDTAWISRLLEPVLDPSS